MKKFLFIAILLLGAASAQALTCTFNWSPITVDVDGNPVSGVQYRIRYYPVGSFNPQTFIDPASIGVVATCPPGLYYVGAYNVANGQSPGGDIVQVRAVNVKMIRSSTN